jgi:hypothetical protein
VRYRLVDRQRSGSGVALFAEAHWLRIDDISGERADRYGADLAVLVDRELVPGRIVAAFNLLYQPDVARSFATGTWSRGDARRRGRRDVARRAGRVRRRIGALAARLCETPSRSRRCSSGRAFISSCPSAGA